MAAEPSTLDRWRSERESAWLYEVVAAAEPDPVRRHAFEQLAVAATAQAAILAGDLGAAPAYRPSRRARLVARIVRRIGPRRARPLLAALKVRGLAMYEGAVHGHPMPTDVAGIGKRHRGRGAGGALRAAVFGVNDGLVSNTSLILGLAGAGAGHDGVVVAGAAGLLAGAFSMAAGEYVSVRSQRELVEHQLAEERAELERYPAEEAAELALIYEARGVPHDRARELVEAMLATPEQALATLAREELGINPDDLGAPWVAAGASFAAFAAGATIPLAPFVAGAGAALPIAIGSAAVTLFAVGATLSLFSGRSALYGGARMLLIGALAGGATYGIGRLLGVTLG